MLGGRLVWEEAMMRRSDTAAEGAASATRRGPITALDLGERNEWRWTRAIYRRVAFRELGCPVRQCRQVWKEAQERSRHSLRCTAQQQMQGVQPVKPYHEAELPFAKQQGRPYRGTPDNESGRRRGNGGKTGQSLHHTCLSRSYLMRLTYYRVLDIYVPEYRTDSRQRLPED